MAAIMVYGYRRRRIELESAAARHDYVKGPADTDAILTRSQANNPS
jgi:hypothetical protein